MSGQDFGGKLRDLRHARGETLEAVSAATGLSVAMLSRVERGERLPSPESVEALAAHFGLPADELMSETIASRLYSRYGAVTSRHAAEKMRAEEPWPGAEADGFGAGEASLPASMAMPEDWDVAGSASAQSPRAQSPAPRPSAPAPRSAAPLHTRTAGTAFVAQPIEALFGEEAALDQLEDAARVAEVALESAMRAVRRARASGDPRQAAEAERVLERLRNALG